MNSSNGATAKSEAGPAAEIDLPAAEAAYREAQAKYENDDFAGALSSMTEAYRRSERPELLYNLGLLERKLQHCAKSLEHYRNYLRSVPYGQHRDDAERASSELNRECPAADAVGPGPPATDPLAAPAKASVARPVVTTKPSLTGSEAGHDTPSPRRVREGAHSKTVIGWSALSLAAVAGVGALYFAFAARSARDAYRESVDLQYHGGPARDTHLQDEQHRDQLAAQVLAVSGGALLTGGLLLLLLTPQHRADRPPASVNVQLGRVEARYSLQF